MGGLLMETAIPRRFNRHAVTRMLAAGAAWGVTLTAGLFLLGAQDCGLPCPGDVAVTTTVSVATGILTIGPIAAFHSRH
jgi:hypothetical protein